MCCVCARHAPQCDVAVVCTCVFVGALLPTPTEGKRTAGAYSLSIRPCSVSLRLVIHGALFIHCPRRRCRCRPPRSCRVIPCQCRRRRGTCAPPPPDGGCVLVALATSRPSPARSLVVRLLLLPLVRHLQDLERRRLGLLLRVDVVEVLLPADLLAIIAA